MRCFTGPYAGQAALGPRRCSIVGSNLSHQDSRPHHESNLETVNPGPPGPWRKTSGTVSIGGHSILALRFGFEGKTAAQVAEVTKVDLDFEPRRDDHRRRRRGELPAAASGAGRTAAADASDLNG